MQDDKIYSAAQAAMRNLIKTPDGKALMTFLMDEYLLQSPEQNADAALFQAGQRDVMILLVGMLDKPGDLL